MDQEIIDYVKEAAPPDTREFQLKFLAELENDPVTLQLDKPIIRFRREGDDVQIATLDVTTGEYAMVAMPDA